MRNLRVLSMRPATSPTPKSRKPVSMRRAALCFACQRWKTQAGGILSKVLIGAHLTARAVRLRRVTTNRSCRFLITMRPPMPHGPGGAYRARLNGNMLPMRAQKRNMFGEPSARLTDKKWRIHGRAVFRCKTPMQTAMPSARRSAALRAMISAFTI